MLQHAIYEALQRFGEKGMRKDSAATRDWTPVEMMKLLRLDPAVAAHPLATEEDCKGNTFFFKETRKAVDGLFGVTQQAGGSKKGNAERRSHLNVTQPAQLLWKDLQVCGRPRNTLFAPPPLFSLPRRHVSPRKRRQRDLWQVPDELFNEYLKTKTSSASSGQVPHRRFRSPPSTLSHFCRFSTPPPPSKVSPRLHIIQAHPFPLRTTLLLSRSSSNRRQITGASLSTGARPTKQVCAWPEEQQLLPAKSRSVSTLPQWLPTQNPALCARTLSPPDLPCTARARREVDGRRTTLPFPSFLFRSLVSRRCTKRTTTSKSSPFGKPASAAARSRGVCVRRCAMATESFSRVHWARSRPPRTLS